MTLQSIGFLLPYPGLRQPLTSGQGAILDGAGEYACVILRAPKTGNITKVGWLPGTISGGGTVDIRVETVDSSGLPSGSLWATNTTLTGVAATTGTWRWDTLTAAAAVVRGDIIAIKFLYASGTSARVRSWTGGPLSYGGLPYAVANTGSPTKSSDTLVAAIQYDDNSIPFSGVLPSSSATTAVTVAETGTPDEVGLKIVLPMACMVEGAALAVGTAARAFDINLYDVSSTLLASSAAVDSDVVASSTAFGLHLFATPVALDAGTYRLVIAPKSGASTMSIAKILVEASATREAWLGGVNAMWTERTDAGAWTDTNTAVPLMDLLISQLDDGAGGGGLLVNPGMSGGLL